MTQTKGASIMNNLWDNLVEYEIATEEELQLVTSINGCNIDTLEAVLYVRTGYRSWKQLEEEVERCLRVI